MRGLANRRIDDGPRSELPPEGTKAALQRRVTILSERNHTLQQVVKHQAARILSLMEQIRARASA